MSNAGGISNKDAILAAMNILTKSNWVKGAYFLNASGTVQMDAHGAVQSKANQEVIDKLADTNVPTKDVVSFAAKPVTDAALAGVVASPAKHSSALAFTDIGKLTQTDAYKARPTWVTNGLDVYYLLGLVGLTAAFNDDPATTFDMVSAKLSLAANLADAFAKAGL